MMKFLRTCFHVAVGGLLTTILCERAGLKGGWIIGLTLLAIVLVGVLFDET